jgi:hypothetical protein
MMVVVVGLFYFVLLFVCVIKWSTFLFSSFSSKQVIANNACYDLTEELFTPSLYWMAKDVFQFGG